MDLRERAVAAVEAGRCRVTRPRRNSALGSAHGDSGCGACVRPQRCAWADGRAQAEGNFGRVPRLVAGARQGRGLRLAWALSPNSPRAASRSIIGRSGNSSRARSSTSKNRGGQRARSPRHREPRGCSGASIKTASSLSVRVSSTRHRRASTHLDLERHHGQSWQLQSHTPIHSRRWRQVLLPAQILAGPESDRADDLRQRKHLLRKAPHASSKRSAPQLLESSLHSPPTNAQIISKFFRLCVNLIAVMHSDVVARDQF